MKGARRTMTDIGVEGTTGGGMRYQDAPLLSREQVEREFQLMFLERTKENQIIREETIKRSYLRLYDAVEALSPEGWERIARLMEEHLMSGHFCLTLAALRAEMEAGDG